MNRNAPASYRKRGQFRRQPDHVPAKKIRPRFRALRRRGIPMLLMWVAVITVGIGIYLNRTGELDQRVALASVPAEDSLSGSFSICGESGRANCVVDGDTFWYQGEKIRVADIDTPELSPPRCAAERIKGEAAKARLRVLLNAGPFALSAGLRDEDKYGRKLRTVTRKGQSLGEVLVGEGLARRWDGARRSWCGN